MKRLAVGIAVLALAGCKARRDSTPGSGLESPEKGDRGTAGVGAGSEVTGAGGGQPGGPGIDIQVLLDGDLEIEAGAIGKDLVRKVVKDHVTKLQYCYEKTLLANPGIEGTVTAKFTIGTDGSVAEVKATGVHPDVETCVSDLVKTFQFPPSEAKVEVSYPFTFKPA